MTALAIRSERQYLATVRDVRDLAERIDNVGDAKALADKAAAAGVWARRAKLGAEQVNLAHAARLWAERRAGELLAADPAVHRGGSKSRSATLEPLGITKSESSRYQRLAAVPAKDFQRAVEEASEQGIVSAARVTALAEGKLDKRVKEEFFAPTPVFDAFWKACSLLIQKANPEGAAGEEWDQELRRKVREWAPLMVERINELAAVADEGGLRVISGGRNARR